MHITYDEEADAAYVYLRDVPVAWSHQLDHARIVDFGSDNAPRGIELLYVSAGIDFRDLPEGEAVARLLAGHRIGPRTTPSLT